MALHQSHPYTVALVCPNCSHCAAGGSVGTQQEAQAGAGGGGGGSRASPQGHHRQGAVPTWFLNTVHLGAMSTDVLELSCIIWRAIDWRICNEWDQACSLCRSSRSQHMPCRRFCQGPRLKSRTRSPFPSNLRKTTCW